MKSRLRVQFFDERSYGQWPQGRLPSGSGWLRAPQLMQSGGAAAGALWPVHFTAVMPSG